MLLQPDWVTAERFERARDEIRARKGDLPALADTRLERFTESHRRRTRPDRLRTIVRQPVDAAHLDAEAAR